MGNNPIKNILLGCYYWDIPHGSLNASIRYVIFGEGVFLRLLGAGYQ